MAYSFTRLHFCRIFGTDMLHYNTYNNNPTLEWVTFVHGAGGSSAIWFKQIREFSKEFNVLLVDLRGHGKSKKHIYQKLKRYTFNVIGDEVIEVMDHLKIKSSHLVGISLGTIIIRELTERYPQRIRSLIMGGAIMKINTRGQILMNTGNMLKSVIPYLFLYKLLAHVTMPSKKNKESRNLFVKEAKKLYQKEFARWFALAAEVNPLLKFFRFKDSGVPTLYIMGSEDYMFLPAITNIVKDHTSAQLEIIDDCGHVVNVEKPDEFNIKSIRFLKSLLT